MCKEGDPGDKFYVIIDGAAGVYLKNEEKSTAITNFNMMPKLDRRDTIQSLKKQRL